MLIEWDAFMGCTNMKEIIVPSGQKREHMFGAGIWEWAKNKIVEQDKSEQANKPETKKHYD